MLLQGDTSTRCRSLQSTPSREGPAAANAWQNGQIIMRTTTYNPTRTLKQSLVAIPLLICALAMPALAQLSGIGKAMKPEFFTRDLIIFIEGLDLDETQQIIVEALFDDYEQSFEEGINRMEVRIEDIQEDIEEDKWFFLGLCRNSC